MWVAILSGSRPRSGKCRQLVAFQSLDLFEIRRQCPGHRQATHSGADNHGTPTNKTTHVALLPQTAKGVRGTLIWWMGVLLPCLKSVQILLTHCRVAPPLYAGAASRVGR